MSTPIERMILRTQGPLSSLEPIAPPRYAPSTSPQPPDETAFTEPPSAPAGAPDQVIPTPSDKTLGQNALSGESQHSRSLVPPATASRRPITPAESQPPSARRDRRADAASPESVPEQRPRRDNEPRPAAVGWPDEDSDLQATTPARRTPAQPPVAVTARLRPADLSEHAGAAVQPPVAATEGDEHAHGPNVTVTIGHIEVRAASAAPARPAGTRFRPQVSLADFLGGNGQGSRR